MQNPGMYICFYSFNRILFIWRQDVLCLILPSRDPGFSNRINNKQEEIRCFKKISNVCLENVCL